MSDQYPRPPGQRHCGPLPVAALQAEVDARRALELERIQRQRMRWTLAMIAAVAVSACVLAWFVPV